jgi:hypothetical protein
MTGRYVFARRYSDEVISGRLGIPRPEIATSSAIGGFLAMIWEGKYFQKP